MTGIPYRIIQDLIIIAYSLIILGMNIMLYRRTTTSRVLSVIAAVAIIGVAVIVGVDLVQPIH